MNVSPSQQRFPRLTRLLPSAAHILWYIVAIVVGRALHEGPFDCRHAFLPCAVTTSFSNVLTVAGMLGIVCLAAWVTAAWANSAGAETGVVRFLNNWLQIAGDLINPVIYVAAVALGIAMFAGHHLWFAFAFILGGGLGLFMQMPTLISLIREFAD
jgi:hypothetical protein